MKKSFLLVVATHVSVVLSHLANLIWLVIILFLGTSRVTIQSTTRISSRKGKSFYNHEN